MQVMCRGCCTHQIPAPQRIRPPTLPTVSSTAAAEEVYACRKKQTAQAETAAWCSSCVPQASLAGAASTQPTQARIEMSWADLSSKVQDQPGMQSLTRQGRSPGAAAGPSLLGCLRRFAGRRSPCSLMAEDIGAGRRCPGSAELAPPCLEVGCRVPKCHIAVVRCDIALRQSTQAGLTGCKCGCVQPH